MVCAGAGEQGEDFFLVESGVVSCTQAKSATDATEMSLLSLGPGDYFGEMALMLDEPRAANCIASRGMVCCAFRLVSIFYVVMVIGWLLTGFKSMIGLSFLMTGFVS